MIRKVWPCTPLTVNCSFRPPGIPVRRGLPDTVPDGQPEAHQQPRNTGDSRNCRAGVQLNDSRAALGHHVSEDGYRPCTPAGCRGGPTAGTFGAGSSMFNAARVYGAAATVTALTDRRGRASSPAGRDRCIRRGVHGPSRRCSASGRLWWSYSMPRRRSSWRTSPAAPAACTPAGSLRPAGDTRLTGRPRSSHCCVHVCPAGSVMSLSRPRSS